MSSPARSDEEDESFRGARVRDPGTTSTTIASLKVFDPIPIHPTVTTRTSVDSSDIIRNPARQLLDVSAEQLPFYAGAVEAE